MRLPFLNRSEEMSRLRRLVTRREASLGVVYGRRRCGKSRLLNEILPAENSVYYIGDDREAALQRRSLATEIARKVPQFDRVTYPDWDSLFARWWSQAKPGMVLALDELPALVAAGREVPSLLQKHVDQNRTKPLHLLLAGSSQRMMQDLVLDRTAPLFGRADEIIKISPLPVGWTRRALRLRDPNQALEAYSVWGGVPRYWELASEYPDLESAIRHLILSPLGVLYDEPARLLEDDMRDTTQANSIMSLIGQGCHRMSEIAARLEKPSTSLSRPLKRLTELGLVERTTPFGVPHRQTRRTLYQIADPFLLFWFRFVAPNRSRLEGRQISAVMDEVKRDMPHHFGEIWEELARKSVPLLQPWGQSWKPASRWWGADVNRQMMEIDIVAESTDGGSVLIGEVKWGDEDNANRLMEHLHRKAQSAPFVRGREVFLALWLKQRVRARRGVKVITSRQVQDALK